MKTNATKTAKNTEQMKKEITPNILESCATDSIRDEFAQYENAMSAKMNK